MSALPLLLSLASPSAGATPVDVGGLTYEVVDIRSVELGTGGVGATVVLELTRTAWPPLVLKGVHVDLLVSGRTVGTATAEQRVKLRPGEPERVEVACELSALESLGAALGSLLSGSRVSAQMAGEVSGRVFLFPKSYAIESDPITL